MASRRTGKRQTLLLELAYDGSAFHGIQPQPALQTVGGSLRALIESTLGVECRGMAFAARTDAGVHARQNFITAWFYAHELAHSEQEQLRHAPAPCLEIRSVRKVNRSCNARNAAQEKHYRYVVCHASPELARQHFGSQRASGVPPQTPWHVAPELCLESMQIAAQHLVGPHDFSAFRVAACGARSPHCSLRQVTVTQSGCEFSIDVVGNRFLRKMVRILVGTLLEVGAGLRDPNSVPRLLDAKNRKLAGLTAPAHGLTLMEVKLDHTAVAIPPD